MKAITLRRLAILIVALLYTIGCSDGAFTTSLPTAASMAKGGQPVPDPQADFSITDAGLSLQSDGKGVYRSNVCGVGGWWDGVGGSFAPASVKIAKSQQASCAGIAPRAASVTLALRHVSDNPHVDESVPSTVWNVANVKWGTGGNGTTTINAGNNGTPICGTLGLRFSSTTFPLSSNSVRDDLGGGLWHLYTRPWPDNKAYCESGGVVTYWHVSFDMYAQVIGT
jgi:hypothetical protein